MPKKSELEIGDEVILHGEIVWIDDDFTPRIHVQGCDYPIRVSASLVEVVAKGKKPRHRIKKREDWLGQEG